MRRVLSEPAMTSLLSPYEPELASSLNNFLDVQYSWKFSRGGGEALSLAARFARAISKKDTILVLGYLIQEFSRQVEVAWKNCL